MLPDTGDKQSHVFAAETLRKARPFHLLQWFILCSSILLTFAAWYFTKKQSDDKVEAQFLREAYQTVELVSERMRKYEDGLWGGVSAIQSHGWDISYREWAVFAASLRIEEKYPGVNGIGVIHYLKPDQLQAYLKYHRIERPAFRIHPEHDETEYWPITYIEPLDLNATAVGLDMAHERNRHSAAQKARDSGRAQLTGPILLVQDESKTPGFLFYVPFYKSGTYATEKERREHFAGLVYAPFVVARLMAGVLGKEKRHVGIKISDGNEVLYDEGIRRASHFDWESSHIKQIPLEMYGRVWVFEIWSTDFFRQANTSNQSLIILLGGLIINVLLFVLFRILSNSNQRAFNLADKMTLELQLKAKHLEIEVASRIQAEKVLAKHAAALASSNAELEQFAYVASHDLQEPLRMIGSFTELLAKRLGGSFDEKTDRHVGYIVEGVTRMKTLINELLAYSRVGKQDEPAVIVDCNEVVKVVLDNLRGAIEASQVEISCDRLPEVRTRRQQLLQVFQNLISNAIKFRSSEPLRVQISASIKKDFVQFSFEDNGIGIDPQFFDRIFEVFQRLHAKSEFEGTGIGLSICKKIIENQGGRISLESEPGKGSTFYFTIPKTGDSQSGVYTSSQRSS